MYPFKLIHLADTTAAIQSGSISGSKFIAGGTNLVDLMKMNVEQPRQLINITGLPLNGIEQTSDGGIHIGALVSNSDLAYHPLIQERYPVLSEALLSGASAQLRNMATVGGNVLQRTRCPYFYDTSADCGKRLSSSGCAAQKGYNRSHAILGGSDRCIATHPSDMCVAMAALNATLHLEGPAGKRSVPFTKFHLIPGNTPYTETVLQPGELITSASLPPLAAGAKSHYLKVRDRASYEFALASAAVVLATEAGIVRYASVAFGGIGTVPWVSPEAARLLTGARASTEVFEAAADAALAGAHPLEYNAFKVALAKRTLVQALETIISQP